MQERPAKASVVLKLRHRSLADGEPEAIRNLVASAVDGLTPDRVVLVDAAGHLPLGPKTAEAMQLSAEQALEEKLIATLEPVTGAGNVRASVTLDYDPAATEETQESYDPDQTVTLSMQRTEQTAGAAAGGRRRSRHGLECAQLAGPARLSAADQRAADRQERVRNLCGFKDRAPCRREPGQGAADDRGHRGERPAGPARLQGQGGAMAAALARGVAQPDRAGAGRGGLRRGARRPADRSRIWPSRTTACSRRSRCPSQLLATAEGSPVLIKYAALLAGLLVVVAFGVRPALRHARLALGRQSKQAQRSCRAMPKLRSRAY